MILTKTIQGKKGRPIGFKLSDASKHAISESKRGQRHKESTKIKISRSLQNYFRRKNPLSEEIINTYCRSDDDFICGWFYDAVEDIDDSGDVLTTRTIFNKAKIEISYGQNIEELFSHSLTPETLLILKETVLDEDVEDMKEEINRWVDQEAVNLKS